MSLATGSLFGEYRVRRRLGVGGIATVYAVQHRRRGTWHALKVLQHAHSRRRDQLRREAELQTAIGGPIVPIEEVIDLHGYFGNVMPLIEGASLFQLASRHTLNPREALVLFQGLVVGIDHAHRAGIVHNDVKPSNVLISPEVKVHLADFGLALRLGELAPAGFAGTPAYASPERLAESMIITKAGDLWSLGIILYELLAGHRPFEATCLVGMRAAVQEPIDFDPIPAPLAPLVAAMLERIPEFRMQSTTELLDALSAFQPVMHAPTLGIKVLEAADHFVEKVPKAGQTMFPDEFDDPEDPLVSDQGEPSWSEPQPAMG
ncbi:MAG: serine/threonine-protein kinase [Myxococcota bacterium]